jgi:predicted adenine nucleotide alpha hydrolase (AANH) superfamily ATPase
MGKIIKPKLLLHICCVGCGAYISETLKSDYQVALYFCNPNIFPEDEYNKRLEEAKKIADEFGLDLIIGSYEHRKWLKEVKCLEKEPEKGKRCYVCYKSRMEETAKIAKAKDYDFFSTTLTISPHKDARAVSAIGRELARKYNINFLDKDFKKQEGFKKSCELSKKLGLYRQNYCGCEFSKI